MSGGLISVMVGCVLLIILMWGDITHKVNKTKAEYRSIGQAIYLGQANPGPNCRTRWTRVQARFKFVQDPTLVHFCSFSKGGWITLGWVLRWFRSFYDGKDLALSIWLKQETRDNFFLFLFSVLFGVILSIVLMWDEIDHRVDRTNAAQWKTGW